ncbi:hypothetical protein HSX11_14115 [Oxalobacteraceae bacterium]|nr:hypothetical protein [Oxalobacteraceae bacterium]
MNMIKLSLAAITLALLGGCAHPLMIAPDAKFERAADAAPRAKAKVGYYIADSARAQTVESPGGGGDKVTVTPYRDLETGFYKVLSNVFDGVTTLKSPNDKAEIDKNGLRYVLTPQVAVTSSSSSAFTWPPTDFSVDLSCAITDPAGQLLDTLKVTGTGKAEFSEFKTDHGLSGKRAMNDALLQLQQKLSDSKLVKGN